MKKAPEVVLEGLRRRDEPGSSLLLAYEFLVIVQVCDVEPIAFPHVSVNVFTPITRGFVFEIADVELTPLMLQVVPAGIVEPPFTRYCRLTLVAFTVEIDGGAKIVTCGAT